MLGGLHRLILLESAGIPFRSLAYRLMRPAFPFYVWDRETDDESQCVTKRFWSDDSRKQSKGPNAALRSTPSTLRCLHGDSGQLRDGAVDVGLRELVVDELAGEVLLVRDHVELAVPREADQHRLRLARVSRG
jgi:hypothetical protein